MLILTYLENLQDRGQYELHFDQLYNHLLFHVEIGALLVHRNCLEPRYIVDPQDQFDMCIAHFLCHKLASHNYCLNSFIEVHANHGVSAEFRLSIDTFILSITWENTSVVTCFDLFLWL